MDKNFWTTAEIAAGYQVMAKINSKLAAEFAPLEEEVAVKFAAFESVEKGE